MNASSLMLVVLLAIPAAGAENPASPKSAEPPASAAGTTPDTRKLSYTVFHVTANAVALTFNDGPHPKNTPRLLDILKEHGVKATFFLIGKNAELSPEIVKRIVDEGHEVGNATWSHKGLRSLSDERIIEELQKAHDAILAAGKVAPLIFRPPFGAISPRQSAMIRQRLNYTTIQWEVDTNDWKAPRTVAKVHDTILKEAHAGSIILCHDIHEPTVEAMPTTLDEMKAKGFQFLTISEMIKLQSDEQNKTKPPTVTTTAPPAPTTPPAGPTTPPAETKAPPPPPPTVPAIGTTIPITVPKKPPVAKP